MWDTAWVRKRVFGKLSRAEARGMLTAVRDQACVRRTSNSQYEALRAMCIRHCLVANSHKLRGRVLEDNVWDMSPLLFELCLLGGGAKAIRAMIG